MKQNIIIVNYDMGNVGSIQNMLKHIGFHALISGEREDIKKADKLILSGVGAFDSGMKNIAETGLQDILNDKVLGAQTPVLGICLGMQLLTQSSEEGVRPGLGWIEAKTVKFSFADPSSHLKIPHMGWNTLNITQQHPLFDDMPDEMRFYFVHSYHVICAKEENCLAATHHGYDFASVIAKGNIYGVQFHPEKSHKFGMTLLHNFIKL